jgi:acyl-coenzyme A thioesterase PaaI-like protein
MAEERFLQDMLPAGSPLRNCYGCGADNSMGLRFKSVMDGDECVATWRPEPHHCSYPGYLNGGVACALIDCHSAWAAVALECRDRAVDMTRDGALPSGWTKAMQVEFLDATPLDAEIELRARLVSKGNKSRTVACSLFAGGKECVRGQVTIVIMQ